MKSARILLASMAGCMAGFWSLQVMAAPITWNTGVTGDWGTGINWSSNTVPVLHDGTVDTISILNGAVTYSGVDSYGGGNDFRDNTTVTVSGSSASWVQSTGNWFKVGDGAGNSGTLNVENGALFDPSAGGNQFIGNGGQGILLVDGGTFKANTLNVAGDSSNSHVSTVTVQNGGAITATGPINVASLASFVMNGGTVNTVGEFHADGPGHEVSLLGGSLTANLISLDGSTSSVIDLGGADVTLTNGPRFQGIFSNGGYVNFLPNSTGIINIIGGVDTSAATSVITDGRVRIDNTTSPLGDYVITPITNGVSIALAPVPEPASLSVVAFAGLMLLPRRRKAC